MKINKYLKPSQILMQLTATNKHDVLEALVNVLVAREKIPHEMLKEVLNALLERETLTSTGVGYGVALPHVKTSAVDQIRIVFGRSTSGVDFDALDGNPVHLFFLILAPAQQTQEYLKVISAISGLMKDDTIRQRLLTAQSVEELIKACE
jgi:fructose-specific phosphotransferase system IIA component